MIKKRSSGLRACCVELNPPLSVSAYVHLSSRLCIAWILTGYPQYGLSSVNVMAAVGSIYLNFGLWAIAIFPAWIIVKEVGEAFGDKKIARETPGLRETLDHE